MASPTKLPARVRRSVAAPGGVRLANLAGTTPEGAVLVDYPGNPCGPVVARAMSTCVETLAVNNDAKLPVLILFENDDPALPVIVGTLAPATRPAVRVVSLGGSPALVSVEGDAIQLRAGRRLSIECGEASIVLHADGSVVIKGRKILSRAAETQKIQGGSVAIN